jgi:hypothetical protein
MCHPLPGWVIGIEKPFSQMRTGSYCLAGGIGLEQI